MRKRTITVKYEIETVVGIVHAGLLLERKFARAIDAWEWAIQNYRGREGWRLTFIERYKAITPPTTK